MSSAESRSEAAAVHRAAAVRSRHRTAKSRKFAVRASGRFGGPKPALLTARFLLVFETCRCENLLIIPLFVVGRILIPARVYPRRRGAGK